MADETEGTAPVPGNDSTAAPPEISSPGASGKDYPPELLEAAAELLRQRQEEGPVQTDAELGASALAAGAGATEVDSGELLRQIQAMQARLDQLEAEKRSANVPDVVKYAQAVADHLGAHAGQVPEHRDGFTPLVGQAGELAKAAQEAADGSGELGKVEELAGEIRRWVSSGPVRRFIDHDRSYLLQLLEEELPAAIAAAA